MKNIALEGAGSITLPLDISETRGVGVMLSNDCPDGGYDIEVSLDGAIWAELSTVTKVSSEPLFIDFTNVTARYFRLLGPGDLTGTTITAMLVSQYS
jgi:hypothetical protein